MGVNEGSGELIAVDDCTDGWGKYVDDDVWDQ